MLRSLVGSEMCIRDSSSLAEKWPDLPREAVEGRLVAHTCGTTATVALLVGESEIVVANTGDSRCILSRAGVAMELSSDHKLEDPAEQERVSKAGFEITQGTPLRISGGLAVPRALGDYAYKQVEGLDAREQAVSALPDIVRHQISAEDEFIVLGCCLLYTSDAADEEDSVDLGGRRIIKKKKKKLAKSDRQTQNQERVSHSNN
eukprot:TRINITY_DN7472_c0_g1_i7.p1 TRINITY_DN7472_c0_g1~~TRINITY_DN7472_c0_g1_i7.p1  ORF type:complete len:204 (-),score=48.91 TRINITY_DN7472_c0_g1_i7:63-674(-)